MFKVPFSPDHSCCFLDPVPLRAPYLFLQKEFKTLAEAKEPPGPQRLRDPSSHPEGGRSQLCSQGSPGLPALGVALCRGHGASLLAVGFPVCLVACSSPAAHHHTARWCERFTGISFLNKPQTWMS